MDMKIIVLTVTGALFVWKLIMYFIDARAVNNPIPENVRDVYDGPTYSKWRAYRREKDRTALISEVLSLAVSVLLLIPDAYARFSALFPKNIWAQAAAVELIIMLSDLIGLPLEIYDTMVTEQKYGFNRTDKKTFALDAVKSVIIGFALSYGLSALLALLHTRMGDMMAFVFAPCLMTFVLALTFLFPYLTRIFNKFTPLEEGELKERLTALLEKHGYTVRAIEVMDASRRSTRSNAYFTGFGKTKTIVLYDTLVKTMTPEEICAVFAHEMGHGLHHDTLRNQLFSLVNMSAIAAMAWLTVRDAGIYASFGFEGVNYAFALLIIMGVWMPVFSIAFGAVTAYFSRRAEYAADAEAVKEGCGRELISSLKKLARENFSDLAPSKFSVKLTWSHPPLSERIKAIEERL